MILLSLVKDSPKMPLKTLTIINGETDSVQNIAFNKKGTFTLLNQYKMVVDDWTHVFPYVTKEVYKISQLVNKNVRVFKQLGKERILAQTYRKDNITIGLRR